MQNQNYLNETPLLDYSSVQIQALIREKHWQELTVFKKIGAAYQFVKDEIAFGYNVGDEIAASQVLADGHGQCNTKGILLMALLRALDIPCRFHGFTINKALQKGAIPSYLYWLAPESIIHSWVEVYFEGKWINLEGFIIDNKYLSAIQRRNVNRSNDFCGYGIATTCLSNPPVEWVGTDTYIQKEGINHDFGVFDSPDDFYRAHGSNLKGVKRLLYQTLFRHLMNQNVASIRTFSG